MKPQIFFWLLIIAEIGFSIMFFTTKEKQQKIILALAFVLAGLELFYISCIIDYLNK